MSDRQIAREESGGKGRYVLREDGAEAELTFRLAPPGRITADHTGVDAALRGTGAGAALVERMVADARAAGLKIVPRCPFVAAQRAKHPDWAGTFAD